MRTAKCKCGVPTMTRDEMIRLGELPVEVGSLSEAVATIQRQVAKEMTEVK